jgi:hypothetical protein
VAANPPPSPETLERWLKIIERTDKFVGGLDEREELAEVAREIFAAWRDAVAREAEGAGA